MPKLSFQQQVLLGFIITLLFIFTGACIAYYRIQDLQNDGRLVDRTQEVIKFTNQVLINIVQAESSVRGLTATGNTYYLDSYNENLSKINPSVDRLASLVKDDSVQLALADSLKFQVSQKLYVMSKILWAFNSNNIESAQTELLADRTINNVQTIIDAIKSKETDLLAKRRSISEANVAKTIQLFLVGSMMILVLFIVLFQFIRISFSKRKLIEEHLVETNQQLHTISTENKLQNWILQGSTALDEAMRGQRDLNLLANVIIKSISLYTNAKIGAIYLFKDYNTLVLAGAYAFDSAFYNRVIHLGEGLVGQVAASKKSFILENVPADYIKIKSALGEGVPNVLFIQPVLFEEKIIGVIELGFTDMPAITKVFVERVVNSIGMAIHHTQTIVQVQNLLENANIHASEYIY